MINPEHLWTCSAYEFNKWRIENDLVELFGFLSKKLTMFDEWISEFKLSKELLISTVPSGGLFIGTRIKTILHFIDNDDHEVCFIVDDNANNVLKRKVKILKNKYQFLPYMEWCKRRLNTKNIILSDSTNKSYTDDIYFNSWSAIYSPELRNAFIFHEFRVLKLGGFILNNPQMFLGERNFDFACLDYLAIQMEKQLGPLFPISYCSIYNAIFSKIIMVNFNFRNCDMENIQFENVTLQDCSIVQSRAIGITFKNTKINGLRFSKSNVANLEFEKCVIGKIKYEPPVDPYYPTVLANFRSIQSAFQSVGRSIEARNIFYIAKNFERKMLFSPYRSFRSEFYKVRKYPGKLQTLVKEWFYLNNRDRLKKFLDIVLYHFGIYAMPLRFFKFIKFKIKYLMSLLDFLFRGYGEKPSRTILSAITIILIYSGIYHCSSEQSLNDSWINSLSFSLITFTTLGYYDRPTEIAPLFKLLYGTEALLGAIFTALLVSVFITKSDRY